MPRFYLRHSLVRYIVGVGFGAADEARVVPLDQELRTNGEADFGRE